MEEAEREVESMSSVIVTFTVPLYRLSVEG